MFNWPDYLLALCWIGAISFAGWLVSVIRRNVTLVDSLWSLFLLVAGICFWHQISYPSLQTNIPVLLLLAWSVRMCAYLTWRNRGNHEDRRYAAIRENNEPHFWLKSIYIIFALQAVLAWIISIALYGAIRPEYQSELLYWAGIAIIACGIAFETSADWQLSTFKRHPENKGKVLNSGVWRYTRHPNYFGECLVWWGFYLVALSAGAWWSIIGPTLMTWLLLKISGVKLLEKDIALRRPEYSEYIRKTSSFFPWIPKQ